MKHFFSSTFFPNIVLLILITNLKFKLQFDDK